VNTDDARAAMSWLVGQLERVARAAEAFEGKAC
jgi:hypothetical protein